MYILRCGSMLIYLIPIVYPMFRAFFWQYLLQKSPMIATQRYGSGCLVTYNTWQFGWCSRTNMSMLYPHVDLTWHRQPRRLRISVKRLEVSRHGCQPLHLCLNILIRYLISLLLSKSRASVPGDSEVLHLLCPTELWSWWETGKARHSRFEQAYEALR